MFGIVLRVKTHPGKFQEFIDFLKWDAQICRDQEPGTLRFEFYQDPEDENAVYVYEAYRDLEAFEDHKRTNAAFHRWNSGYREEVGVLTFVFAGDALGSAMD